MKIRFLALAAFLLLAACAAPKPSPVRITLVADGTRTPITPDAPGATVRDVLHQANITLNDLDSVRPPESVALSDGMTITITRVIQRTETQTQTLPYTQQTVRDATVPAGQTRVLQAGHNGMLELTYRLTFEDGVQTERVETRREVIEQPVTEVVLVGIENVLDAIPFTGTIAYLANNNAFVMRQATSSHRPLTTSGDLDGRVFSLSPDGKWLLFTRALTETTEGGPLNSMWVVDTVHTPAAPKLLKSPGVISAVWSPDGDAIAYSTATASNSPPGWSAANDLWVASFQAETLGAPERILEPSTGGMFGWWGANYAWSPDGESIAIGSTDHVAMVDLRTRKQTTLADFAAYNTYSNWAWTPSVTWTPDSKFIVTVLHGPSPSGEPPESSPVFDVWALTGDGSFQARLASASGMWAAPHASTANGYIVFGRAQAPYASADSRYDLFKIDRDGSNRVRLFPAEGKPGLQGKPDFATSPEGTHIVVAYQRDLYFVNLATGASQQLVIGGDLSAPRWSR
jgi:resuscitation-promoting factor RpfB